MQSYEYTARTGQQIRIDVHSHAFTLFIDGKEDVSTGRLQKAPANDKGVVAIIGKVGLTADRKADLEALQAQELAAFHHAQQGKSVFDTLSDATGIPARLLELEAALTDARERVLHWADNDANPASAYAAEAKAEAALASWKEQHPAEWTQAQAVRRANREAERQVQNEIQRGREAHDW